MNGGGVASSSAGTFHPQLPHDTVGAGPAAASLHLLDLPTELLTEVLRDAPRSARATCRTFRDLLDGGQQALSLHPPPTQGVPRRLHHLSALLRRLPALTSLHVGTFEFKTLTFLTACPTLESFTMADAVDVPHKALLSLAACPRLRLLDLKGCQHLRSLTFTSTLTALRSLDLSGCNLLTSLQPLSHCPHITSLTLGRHVVSLAPLTALASLASLTCASVAMTDLTPLAPCAASLTRLSFRRSRLQDLSPLLHHTRLASLEVTSYHLSSLAPLAHFGASLTRLRLGGCEVDDLHPLTSCVALNWLALECLSALTNISPLSSCTLLSTLSLYECDEVVSLAPLSSLGHSLTSLSLDGCSCVAFFLPLASCTALTHLDISWTDVTSVAPLSSCTRLTTLRAVRCSVPPEQWTWLQQQIPQLHLERE